MISQTDTIAAVATAPGDSGIAVIRVSGDDAHAIAKKAFVRKARSTWQYMRLYYGTVTEADGSVLDEAMCVLMKAPRTYTCEDVAEIQCHGGHIVTERVLRRILALGARPAEPGEFTRRAFMNGRIDLSEAEAVMQLISAGSETAARASVRQLEGGVSGFVREMRAELIREQAALEAATDYPEEIDETETAEEVLSVICRVRAELKRGCDPEGARMIREGVSVAICGKPNAGKSSLLNALLKQDMAIVTDIPGTTRDVLTCRMQLNGLVLELSDTAGQRDTEDAVEKIGVERARNTEKNADIVLLLADASNMPEDDMLERFRGMDDRYIAVLNKWDIAYEACRTAWKQAVPAGLPVSAKCSEGLDALLQALMDRCGAAAPAENGMTMLRHIRAAERCIACLDRAEQAITGGLPLDIVSGDLREALSVLGEITGEDISETVIDEIFKNFCVGK